MTITAIPKPRTFNADLARLPAALLPLTMSNRWVIWKWEQRADKVGNLPSRLISRGIPISLPSPTIP